jgi:hypothetical protein
MVRSSSGETWVMWQDCYQEAQDAGALAGALASRREMPKEKLFISGNLQALHALVPLLGCK